MKITNKHKNNWNLVALSSQVIQGKPFRIKRLQSEYVLFRDTNNNLHALEDRCAHRRAPLSLGVITTDGSIQCPYHGWTFEGQHGKCIRIPNLSNEEPLPTYKVQSFITREVHGFIYLWSGDQSDINENDLQSLQSNIETITAEDQSLITMDFQCMMDVLLDSPSLLINLKGIKIIDDHVMGEPSFNGRVLTIERAADWKHKAKRRSRIPSDLPLVLRTQLDVQYSNAYIELFDDSHNLLCAVTLGGRPVTTAVSQVLWRWVKSPTNSRRYSKMEMASLEKINFSVREAIDPSLLVAVTPYISATLNTMIDSSCQSEKPSK